MLSKRNLKFEIWNEYKSIIKIVILVAVTLIAYFGVRYALARRTASGAATQAYACICAEGEYYWSCYRVEIDNSYWVYLDYSPTQGDLVTFKLAAKNIQGACLEEPAYAAPINSP